MNLKFVTSSGRLVGRPLLCLMPDSPDHCQTSLDLLTCGWLLSLPSSVFATEIQKMFLFWLQTL